MNSKSIPLALLCLGLLLFGCTSASYAAPSGNTTASATPANINLQPLALPSLAASIPAATPTPTPTPTATAAPTPTPKPAGSCVIAGTNIGQNQYTGKYQYTVRADFTNLPADVQLADVSCDGGETSTTIEIKNGFVERICSYTSSNQQTATAAAGLATCQGTIG